MVKLICPVEGCSRFIFHNQNQINKHMFHWHNIHLDHMKAIVHQRRLQNARFEARHKWVKDELQARGTERKMPGIGVPEDEVEMSKEFWEEERELMEVIDDSDGENDEHEVYMKHDDCCKLPANGKTGFGVGPKYDVTLRSRASTETVLGWIDAPPADNLMRLPPTSPTRSMKQPRRKKQPRGKKAPASPTKRAPAPSTKKVAIKTHLESSNSDEGSVASSARSKTLSASSAKEVNNVPHLEKASCEEGTAAPRGRVGRSGRVRKPTFKARMQ